MNVVILHGSMRKGNTYKLTQEAAALLIKRGVSINEFSVSKLALPFCESCHACFSKGEAFCPHKEIIAPIAAAIESCDGLIISGVVYSLHLNAAMKNLIDHLSYYFHRPRLFSKKALIITTTAGAAENRIAKYLTSVLGHWGVGYIKSFSCKIQTSEFLLNEKQRARLEAAASAFYDAVSQNKTTPPSFESVAVHNAFRAMSLSPKGPSECDRAYWQECSFAAKAYPRPIGPFLSAFGALVFGVMSKVFSKK